MKIVSIVGKKNTGKTSLTIKVIEELTSRGYNVASIKHSHHSMEMDKENTDTWRHKQAGSKVTVGIGSTTFFNIKKEFNLERLLFLIKHFDNTDFVIIEGFKKYNYPKIVTSPDVIDEYTIKEVNSFTIDEKGIKELVDIIEKKGHDIINTLFLNNCGFNDGESIAKEIREGNLENSNLDRVNTYLSINDNVIGLNKFVSDYIQQIILNIVNTLHIKEYGVDEIKKIELLINNNIKTTKATSSKIFINKEMLEINEFVSSIVSNSIKGMINSLKFEEKPKKIEINITNIDKDLYNSNIIIKINNEHLKINKFVRGILKETIYGIITTLSINTNIKEIQIELEE